MYKTLGTTLSIVALSTAFLSAASKSQIIDKEYESANYTIEGDERDRPNAISVKPFWAKARNKIYSNVSEKIDLYGFNFDYNYAIVDGSVGAIEFVGNLGFGYGEGDYSYSSSYYYWHRERAKFQLSSINFAAGVNFRLKFGEVASVFVGPRLGLNMMNIRCEDGGDEETSNGFGALYGGEVGLEFHLAPTGNVSLAFAVDYLRSTAAPKFDTSFEGKMSEQEWLVFNVGLKFRF